MERTSLNFSSVPPLSGWWMSDILRYPFLISSSVAFDWIPNVL